MGAPEAAMSTPGCPLGALWPPLGPSKIIEKPEVFVAFSAMGRIWGAPWGILAASESALDGPVQFHIDNEMYHSFRRQSE